MKSQVRWGRAAVARLAIGAIAACFAVGMAKADTDGITNSSNVPVSAHLFKCGAAPTPAGTAWTPSAFSFDISWVDPDLHAYFLADRSHNGVTTTSGGNGDVLLIDIESINLTSPNATVDDPNTTTYLLPPANDPMAGMGCDMNTAFGGTAGVGRNEITGPNGLFTVNNAEIWVGDGPGKFQPLQGDGTVTLTNGSATITSCASTGAVCTYSGVPSDYVADPCNSSVRVFDVASRKQTDHINVHGCFRTDEGAFDPEDQIAVFANPSEQPITSPNFAAPLNTTPFLTFISTTPVAPGQSHPILKQINFDGKHGTVLANGGLEQAVYSTLVHKFFIAIPGNSAGPNDGFVAVIDPSDAKNIHVEKIYHLTGCSPNGAVLGPGEELLVGCAVGPEQVVNIKTGKTLSIAGTSGGCDEVAFNAGDNHYLGACTDSNAADDNLDISDSNPVNFDQAINTGAAGAHSVAADPVTVTDYQPAAAASSPGPNAASRCGANPCVLIYSSSGGNDAAGRKKADGSQDD
jgi:hypothetical protein